MPGKFVSVVAPVFNEEATIGDFYRRLLAALEGVDFEIVFVDDGSTDRSPEQLALLAAADPRVTTITLSRNFGHQAALSAGIEHANGDAVVMLDSDLQDPPELIPTMLARWQAGDEVVVAVRRHRDGETAFKLATAGAFYRIFGRLSNVDMRPDAGDFRLLDRRALDALLSMEERSRFLRGMTAWIGFRQGTVEYDREARPAGATKWTLRRMVGFSLDGILSFSRAPLHAATLLGFTISIFAFLAIPVVLALRLAGHYIRGFGTLTIVVLLLGGIQLVAIGVLGEYLARIFEEVKRRPLYVMREPPSPAARPDPQAELVASESELPR